jgi:hypothetical protein
MIGGIESTRSSEPRRIGYCPSPSRQAAYEALGVGIDGPVANRELHQVELVDARGDVLAASPEGVGELLLGLDEAPEHPVVDGRSPGEEGAHVGADALHLRGHLDDAGRVGGEEGVARVAVPGAALQLPGDTLGRPGVGAVGVVELDLELAVAALFLAPALQLALGPEQVLDQAVGVDGATEQTLDLLLGGLDGRHLRPPRRFGRPCCGPCRGPA